MRSVLRLLGSGLVIGLFCVIASAQAIQTGGITGVVTDKNGALVTGATVNVISEATGKSVRTPNTGGDGGFAVTLLPPGTYRLEISAPNFKKAVVAGVEVRITETTRQDVSLEPLAERGIRLRLGLRHGLQGTYVIGRRRSGHW